MPIKPWIGVDLDKTLATYKGFSPRIGLPIPKMVARVKHWLAQGKTVKIFTARADNGPTVIRQIQDWTEKYLGQRLEVTNIKDRYCEEIWDDKARQVEPNTGRLMATKLVQRHTARLRAQSLRQSV